MSTVVAYVLVVLLVQFCFTAGSLLAGFPAALLLAWSSVSLRTRVAGFIGGVAGVALAVGFGYGVFHLLVGRGSFTVGAFLASTVPLLIPIRNDFRRAQRVEAARTELLHALSESRGEDATREMAAQTQTAHGSAVAGEVAGLVLATVWFVGR